MPRGRPIDHDKRISSLVAELREALAAKEEALLEARVEAQVRRILSGVNPTYGDAAYGRLARAARISPKGHILGNGKRGGSSDPAGIRRRGPGKGNPKLKSKLKAHWASMTPAERKARIEKMHAWRKAKK